MQVQVVIWGPPAGTSVGNNLNLSFSVSQLRSLVPKLPYFQYSDDADQHTLLGF